MKSYTPERPDSFASNFGIFPSSAERCDGTTKLLVIDDDRMFREFEVPVRCDLDRSATLGKPFALEHLVRNVRSLLAHVAPLPLRKP